jgi:hypothetical protein
MDHRGERRCSGSTTTARARKINRRPCRRRKISFHAWWMSLSLLYHRYPDDQALLALLVVRGSPAGGSSLARPLVGPNSLRSRELCERRRSTRSDLLTASETSSSGTCSRPFRYRAEMAGQARPKAFLHGPLSLGGPPLRLSHPLSSRSHRYGWRAAVVGPHPAVLGMARRGILPRLLPQE